MDGQLGMAGSLRINAIERVVRLVVRIKPAMVTNRQSRINRFARDNRDKLNCLGCEDFGWEGWGDLGFVMRRLTTIALWCDGVKMSNGIRID